MSTLELESEKNIKTIKLTLEVNLDIDSILNQLRAIDNNNIQDELELINYIRVNNLGEAKEILWNSIIESIQSRKKTWSKHFILNFLLDLATGIYKIKN